MLGAFETVRSAKIDRSHTSETVTTKKVTKVTAEVTAEVTAKAGAEFGCRDFAEPMPRQIITSCMGPLSTIGPYNKVGNILISSYMGPHSTVGTFFLDSL